MNNYPDLLCFVYHELEFIQIFSLLIVKFILLINLFYFYLDCFLDFKLSQIDFVFGNHSTSIIQLKKFSDFINK